MSTELADKVSLRCIECGEPSKIEDAAVRCECGGLLDVRRDLSGLNAPDLQASWRERLGSFVSADRSGVWRFRDLVVPLEPQEIAARGEGNTGLYDAPSVAGWADVSRLYMKHEGENPTGSFKDRGMTVGVSMARKLGATTVACASTGNTSASLASYAAIAGMQCIVLVPVGKTSAAKLSQAVAYGTKTVAVRGDFDEALALLERLAPELGLYILNSINPWRLEGQKTVMLESLEALGWQTPDWIILPGGNLGNTAAFSKALIEARLIGLINRLPRIAIVQAAGAAPFEVSYREGWADLRPVKAETLATAIRIGDPVNFPKAKAGVRALNGVVVSATDEEIMDAKAVVDRSGVGCEPASAASIAGLRKLREQGVVEQDATVLAVLTGHLLKDPDATWKYHTGGGSNANPLIEIDAMEDAFRAVTGVK